MRILFFTTYQSVLYLIMITMKIKKINNKNWDNNSKIDFLKSLLTIPKIPTVNNAKTTLQRYCIHSPPTSKIRVFYASPRRKIGRVFVIITHIFFFTTLFSKTFKDVIICIWIIKKISSTKKGWVS